jgi:hypothetical protein
MEHQIIKKISSINDFDNDDDLEDIVEHNNTTNKTHMKNISSSLATSGKGTILTNLSVSPSSAVSQTQSSNNNKWTHNNSNHINTNCVSSNTCSTPANTSINVSNSTPNSAKKTKNIVANNLAPIKDDHVLRSAFFKYYLFFNSI